MKNLVHDTFTLERTFKAGRERAFAAWSAPKIKAKWFAGPAGKWTEVKRELDFRVGGNEIVRGAFPDGGSSQFDATYMDIVDGERIVYAYRMYTDDVLLSISLVTVAFEDAGTGSKTIFTEQGVYFATPEAAEGRRKGSEMLLDNIGRTLEGAQ